jgi:hypothetical protein
MSGCAEQLSSNSEPNDERDANPAGPAPTAHLAYQVRELLRPALQLTREGLRGFSSAEGGLERLPGSASLAAGCELIDRLDRSLPYEAHELSRALLAPVASLALAGACLFSMPRGWSASLPVLAASAAWYELVYRMVKDYPKPEFGINDRRAPQSHTGQ